ncbi:hypothetical protein ANO11243_070330 [Dothideomycetidae sp. 11243]|nr:hypothetical protein ANO11243_070330 [fungal sp. No.11243]
MNKIWAKASEMATSAAKKFTDVSVPRGKTAFPKTSKDLENLGLRWDFDGEVVRDGKSYNKFQVQTNSGKIPSTLKDWQRENGGTHAVMGTMYVKKEGDKDDVKEGFDEFVKSFKG